MTEAPPVEIERKFLVSTLPNLQKLEAFQVRQGYLTSVADSVEVRLRQKGAAYFMTLKSGAGLQRLEYEILIDKSQFDALWPATDGRRIEKTRYLGNLEDHLIFELDVFSGRLASLILVEVEFETVNAATNFTPPAWFGLDVTDDKRFKNKTLAMNGQPAA
jgi:adenylate cyclase